MFYAIYEHLRHANDLRDIGTHVVGYTNLSFQTFVWVDRSSAVLPVYLLGVYSD